MTFKADPRLIVALDEPNLDAARALIAALGDTVSFYKIGLTLLAQGGVSLCGELAAQGRMIFQDWKLHDIGAQVQGAARAVSNGACHLLTVHAEPQVMKAAVAGQPTAQAAGSPSARSMSSVSFSGLVVGPKRLRTFPSRPTRNLVKFHLIALVSRPPSSERSHR